MRTRTKLWGLLFSISSLLGSGMLATPAGAAEEEEPVWWVVTLKGEPALCGQTSDGMLLCLNPESLRPTPAAAIKKAGAFKDWSFVKAGPGPI